MHARRLSVKLFVTPDPTAPVELAPFIALFHGFIQRGAVEGLLVDVADYAHVPNGPGVVLVGHDVDYGLDASGGRAGLLVVRKRCGDLSLGEALRDTLRKAFVAARAVMDDGRAGVRLATDRLELRVLDRRAAPNTDEGREALVKEAEPVLREVFGDGVAVAPASADDARGAVGLAISLPRAVDPEVLVAGLGGARLRAPESAGDAVQSEWDIAAEELARLRQLGADLVLVDVREEEEYVELNLGGRHIPLGSLSGRIAELDRAAHVVVHCKMGGRGAQAVRLLRAAGFENAWNLRGGLDAWIERIDPELAKS
jgi:rhodanese-related sulfurtransferase